jgi:hypothetical protein
MKKISVILCWLSFSLGCPVALLAQTTSTEILGTVTDPSGAAVPGATVTILRVATGKSARP